MGVTLTVRKTGKVKRLPPESLDRDRGTVANYKQEKQIVRAFLLVGVMLKTRTSILISTGKAVKG